MNTSIHTIKTHIQNHLLIATIGYVVILCILQILLYLCGLFFRQWVFLVCIALALLGFIAGICQSLVQIQRKRLRTILLGFFMIGIILTAPFVYTIAIFTYKPEHVVEKDGKKYVVYVDSFLHTTIYYFEYKNPIVSGNKIIRQENYDSGIDPFQDENHHPMTGQ